jgi:hypothetical protein
VSLKKNNAKRTISLIYNKITEGKILTKHNKATTEALLIGIYKNIDQLENLPASDLQSKYNILIHDENFSLESLSGGISGREKVLDRIHRAIEIFGE